MRKGKGHRRGGDDEKVSKAMSKVLRHAAVEEGLQIDSSGYVELQELMTYLRRKGLQNINQERINNIVDNNDKKRFEIEERKHHTFIRATQGHSMKCVNTEDLLTKITDPKQYPIVVHGTFRKFWPFIKEEGLKRMSRNHIHFAPGMPKEEGVISGMRGSCDIIIQIDLESAFDGGIQFYISNNNVILTEGLNGVLPPKYFKRVTTRNGEVILEREGGKAELQEKPEPKKVEPQQKYEENVQQTQEKMQKMQQE